MKRLILLLSIFTIIGCSKDKGTTNNCDTPSLSVSPNENYITVNGGSGSDYYEAEYGLTGFTKGTGTKKTISGIPAQISDLANGTYDIYFRANCGGSSFSEWSTVQSFVIDGSSNTCSKPNYLSVDYNNASRLYVLGWSGSNDYYDVEYGPTGFTLGTGTQIRTNSYSTTDVALEAGTTYDFYVKGNCGGSKYSGWAGPRSFLCEHDQNICSKPYNISATKASSTRINYSFIDPNYVFNYQISLSTSNTTRTGTVYNTDYTSGYFTGTFNAATYYFWVRINCDVSSLGYSPWVVFRVN